MENKKIWILEFLSSGKGVIPYEKTKDYDCLNIQPETSDNSFLKN